jgi:general secretion pathway protein B
MSFLLDALRKSEDQKRRGAVPTIHGDTGPAVRRSMPRPALYALLVVVPILMVLAWYLWRGDDTRPDQVQAVTDPTPVTPVSTSRQPEQWTTERGPGEPERSPAPPDASRTPVERYEAPRVRTQGVETVAEPGEAGPPSGSPEPQQASSSAGSTGTSNAVAKPSAPEPAAPVVTAPPADATTQADMPGLISYWELPGSVREQIMELRISVMVFAELAADRFILMNGRRWVEGDEPQQGLRVEEIRREGVVFSFQRYRFLLSR